MRICAFAHFRNAVRAAIQTFPADCGQADIQRQGRRQPRIGFHVAGVAADEIALVTFVRGWFQKFGMLYGHAFPHVAVVALGRV